jgi:hypothetical protein
MKSKLVSIEKHREILVDFKKIAILLYYFVVRKYLSSSNRGHC